MKNIIKPQKKKPHIFALYRFYHLIPHHNLTSSETEKRWAQSNVYSWGIQLINENQKKIKLPPAWNPGSQLHSRSGKICVKTRRMNRINDSCQFIELMNNMISFRRPHWVFFRGGQLIFSRFLRLKRNDYLLPWNSERKKSEVYALWNESKWN